MINLGQKTIVELDDIINRMPEPERKLFERFFRVDTVIGKLEPPECMEAWIVKNFGSVDKVKSQKIVKTTNLLTMEGALFNEIRAKRPMELKVNEEIRQVIENSAGDPFCKVREGTPADLFGRVEGTYATTAGNVAKYDGYHGLVVFKEHNPLMIHKDAITDYFETGLEWARRAFNEDIESKYYFFMWNCLWKSGASVIHGHAQTTMTKGMHYPKVESLRRVVNSYRQSFGGSYFDDLFRVHQALGLAWEWDGGVKGLVYLTPIKEKETFLWLDKPGVPLYHAVHAVLEKFMAMNAISFNVAFYVAPLDFLYGRQGGEDWTEFPALVRIVDRGDPNNKTADIGAMELYAASVVSSDPFQLAEVMKGSH